MQELYKGQENNITLRVEMINYSVRNYLAQRQG